MIAVQFKGYNVILGLEQDDYEPLPAAYNVENGLMSFCFRLSDEELAEINRTRTVWIQQKTFGHPFQPIGPSAFEPEEF